MMEKRNVVEADRTPDAELNGSNEDWDKQAAESFGPVDAGKDKKDKDGELPAEAK